MLAAGSRFGKKISPLSNLISCTTVKLRKSNPKKPMLIVGWALPTYKNTREVQDVSNENSLSPLPIFKSDPPSLSLHLLNNPHRLHADGAES